MGACQRAGGGMLATGHMHATAPVRHSMTVRELPASTRHTAGPATTYMLPQAAVTDLHADIWRRHATMATVTPSGGSCSWLKLLLLPPPCVLTTAAPAHALLLPPSTVRLLLLNWLRSCARQGKLSRACTGMDTTKARHLSAGPLKGAN